MARIRSIKPEFSTDGDMLRLSDSCALFFILLWNFCDDEGKHKLDLKQIASELGGRWHQGKVKLYVSCLINSGQLRLNSDSTWIQVTGWSHQKIDKPKQPTVKSIDLQWLTHEESSKALEPSRPIDARIGSDRIDRIGSDQGSEKSESANPPAKVVPMRKPKAPAPDGTNLVVARYMELWKERYKATAPIRGKPTGNLATLTKDYGHAAAIAFIEAYFQMPDPWFVTKRHDPGTLLQNLSAVAQFNETGRMFSRKEVQNLDKAVNAKNTLDLIERGEI